MMNKIWCFYDPLQDSLSAVLMERSQHFLIPILSSSKEAVELCILMFWNCLGYGLDS